MEIIQEAKCKSGNLFKVCRNAINVSRIWRSGVKGQEPGAGERINLIA